MGLVRDNRRLDLTEKGYYFGEWDFLVIALSEFGYVNSKNFRGVTRLNFLISAIYVIEPASAGDYHVIKHSVPKIWVAIERNKYQNVDRSF